MNPPDRLHPRAHPPFARGVIALAAFGCVSAFAQSAPAPADAASAAGTVQSVTVTATRRAESLQSVPIAVSVLSGEHLEEANRNTLGAITSEVPSVNFRTGASNKDTSLFVRGVGTISTSPGVEPTVATVIDGVVLARPGQATLDLVDVDRIEVLRGPQGTLFGKNASAGVLNIVTVDPGAQTQRYVDLSHYGGGNENRARAGISGTLAPGVRGALTVLDAKYDGNVTNVYNGEKVNGTKKQGARGKLVFTPAPDLKLTLGADFLHSRDDIPVGVVTSTSLIAYPSGTVTSYPAFAAALGPVVASADNRAVNSNLTTAVNDNNGGLSAQADWKLGGYDLTAITAWRTWSNAQAQDGDRLSAPAVGLPQSHDHGWLSFRQVSEELRVASPQGGAFDYVAGLYLLHDEDRETYRRDVLRVVADGSSYADWGLAHYGTRQTSAAVFGEGRVHITDALRGIVGLRLTDDDLSYTHERSTSTPDAQFAGAIPGVSAAIAQSTGSTSKTGRSGRVGAQVDLSDDVTSYATFSRGYKGPAYNVFFNMLARDQLALKPETSNSFELGLKSVSLERRLRVNVAAFLTRYDNYQANFYDSVNGAVVTRLINAGQVSSRGVELDAEAHPTSQLSVSGALAYTRARIDDFNCPVGAAASCAVNGKPLPFSPDWKGSVRANYRVPLSNGLQLDLGSDYNWQSQVQYDIGQYADTKQGAYGIVNASAAVSTADHGWRVAFVGKNLADRSYASFLARGSAYVNRWVPRDDQRYFGIDVRHEF
jgi:iron complex outermembrane receptor protein